MSDEYSCDDCAYAREAINEELAYGTHYCKVKEEYVQCYVNCSDWKEISVKELAHGDEVKLVGRHNPYKGESGEFIQHERMMLEKDRLIVLLDSDKRQHYFYENEVVRVGRYKHKSLKEGSQL